MTGTAVSASPAPEPVRPGAAPAPAPELARARASAAFVATAVFSVPVNLLMLAGPVFMLLVYDRVLPSRSVPTLVVLIALVGALYAFLALFDVVRRRILARVGNRLADRLAGPVFAARLGPAPAAGTSAARPLADLATIRQFLLSGAPLALFDLPWLPVFLVVVFLLHPLLGLVALGGAVVLAVLALLAQWTSRADLAEAATLTAESDRLAADAWRGAEAARALGMVGALHARWRARGDAAASVQTGATDRISLVSTFTRAFRLFIQSAILGAGAWLALRGEATPGTMVAAAVIMGRALAPLDQTIGNWRQIAGARDAWRRLGDVLAAAAPPTATTGLPQPTGRLEVRGLVLASPDGTRAILQGIGFSIGPGDALGVIGPTGAGKSSLARALVGIWPPARGEIRLDGATLDQYGPETLGRHVGYLPQDLTLFEGTVRDNVARFHPEATDEQVIEAARHAFAHEMILTLPEGYDTALGPGGTGLSGGQRQRIALARALFGDPALVVLDEPTANLDAEGEVGLNRSVLNLRKRGRTVVVTTHRPGAIANVSVLLSLVGGRQAAFGPRNEVLKKVLRLPDKPGGGLSAAPDESPSPAAAEPESGDADA